MGNSLTKLGVTETVVMGIFVFIFFSKFFIFFFFFHFFEIFQFFPIFSHTHPPNKESIRRRDLRTWVTFGLESLNRVWEPPLAQRGSSPSRPPSLVFGYRRPLVWYSDGVSLEDLLT